MDRIPPRIPAFLSCLLIFFFAFSPVSRGQTSPADDGPPAYADSEDTAPKAPIVIDGTTLFSVRGFEAYSPERRAGEIRERIIQFAKNPALSTKDLRVEETGFSADIMIGDKRIFSVLESDAKRQNLTRIEFAKAAVIRIAEAVDQYRADRSRQAMTRAVLLAISALVVFLVATLVLLGILRRILRALERRFRTRIQALKVGSLELLQAEHVWGLLSGLLRAIRFFTLLALLYFFLEYTLALFPWSRGIANGLIRFVMNPLVTMGKAVVAYLPNLAFLFILAVVTVYALKLIKLFFNGISNGTVSFSGFDRDWARPTYNLIRILVIAFALVVAYPYIPGSESDAFKGVSIFLGVIFSLGSTSAISNLIAGYTMIYRRAFKIGDRIQIGEHCGIVVTRGLLTTNLRTIKNEIVVVPNSLILSSNLVNYTTLALENGLILHTVVGIGFDTSWRQVDALLKTAADRTSGLLKEPKPFVLLTSLNQFSVNYEINAYCRDSLTVSTIYAELHRNILDLFNEYGVQIMTPAYEGDPEKPKVVPREKWYAPPAQEPNAEKK